MLRGVEPAQVGERKAVLNPVLHRSRKWMAVSRFVIWEHIQRRDTIPVKRQGYEPKTNKYVSSTTCGLTLFFAPFW
jgi:hypothetical protein